MFDKNVNIRQRFSIRKYTLGATSILLGAFLLAGPTASANEIVITEDTEQETTNGKPKDLVATEEKKEEKLVDGSGNQGVSIDNKVEVVEKENSDQAPPVKEAAEVAESVAAEETIKETRPVTYRVTLTEEKNGAYAPVQDVSMTFEEVTTRNKATNQVISVDKGITKEGLMKYVLTSLYDYVDIKYSDNSPFFHDNAQHIVVVLRKKEFDMGNFLKELENKTDEERYVIAKRSNEMTGNKYMREFTQPELDMIMNTLDKDLYNEEVLKFINGERKKVGANPLELNKEWAQGTETRAEEQAEIGYFRSVDNNGDGIPDEKHKRPDGRDFYSAFTISTTSTLRTENASQYLPTDIRELISEKWYAEKQVERFMTSTDHKANMLDKQMNLAYFGMGLSADHLMLVADKNRPEHTSRTQTNGQSVIFIQEFGRKRSIALQPTPQPVEPKVRYIANDDLPKGQVGKTTLNAAKTEEAREVGTKEVLEEVVQKVTRYEADATLTYNMQKERQAGQEGLRTTTILYNVDSNTGAITTERSRTVTDTILMKERVVAVGNKEVVTEEIQPGDEYVVDAQTTYKEKVRESEGRTGLKTTTKTYEVNPTDGSLSKEQEVVVIKAAVNNKWKVGNVDVQRTPIAIITTYIEDETLAQGEEREQDPGLAGEVVRTVTYKVDSKIGLTTEILSDDTQTTPMSQRIVRVGTKKTVEEKPVETPKGTIVEIGKGTGIKQEAKPEAETPVITSKDQPLFQEAKPEEELLIKKGAGLVQGIKPEAETPKIASKNQSLFQGEKPKVELLVEKGISLQEEVKSEAYLPSEKVENKEESTRIQAIKEKILPKTSANNEYQNSALTLALALTLSSAGLISVRKKED